jgi:hypothetical protein
MSNLIHSWDNLTSKPQRIDFLQKIIINNSNSQLKFNDENNSLLLARILTQLKLYQTQYSLANYHKIRPKPEDFNFLIAFIKTILHFTAPSEEKSNNNNKKQRQLYLEQCITSAAIPMLLNYIKCNRFAYKEAKLKKFQYEFIELLTQLLLLISKAQRDYNELLCEYSAIEIIMELIDYLDTLASHNPIQAARAIITTISKNCVALLLSVGTQYNALASLLHEKLLSSFKSNQSLRVKLHFMRILYQLLGAQSEEEGIRPENFIDQRYVLAIFELLNNISPSGTNSTGRTHDSPRTTLSPLNNNDSADDILLELQQLSAKFLNFLAIDCKLHHAVIQQCCNSLESAANSENLLISAHSSIEILRNLFNFNEIQREQRRASENFIDFALEECNLFVFLLDYLCNSPEEPTYYKIVEFCQVLGEFLKFLHDKRPELVGAAVKELLHEELVYQKFLLQPKLLHKWLSIQLKAQISNKLHQIEPEWVTNDAELAPVSVILPDSSPNGENSSLSGAIPSAKLPNSFLSSADYKKFERRASGRGKLKTLDLAAVALNLGQTGAGKEEIGQNQREIQKNQRAQQEIKEIFIDLAVQNTENEAKQGDSQAHQEISNNQGEKMELWHEHSAEIDENSAKSPNLAQKSPILTPRSPLLGTKSLLSPGRSPKGNLSAHLGPLELPNPPETSPENLETRPKLISTLSMIPSLNRTASLSVREKKIAQEKQEAELISQGMKIGRKKPLGSNSQQNQQQNFGQNKGEIGAPGANFAEKLFIPFAANLAAAQKSSFPLNSGQNQHKISPSSALQASSPAPLLFAQKIGLNWAQNGAKTLGKSSIFAQLNLQATTQANSVHLTKNNQYNSLLFGGNQRKTSVSSEISSESSNRAKLLPSALSMKQNSAESNHFAASVEILEELVAVKPASNRNSLIGGYYRGRGSEMNKFLSEEKAQSGATGDSGGSGLGHSRNDSNSSVKSMKSSARGAGKSHVRVNSATYEFDFPQSQLIQLAVDLERSHSSASNSSWADQSHNHSSSNPSNHSDKNHDDPRNNLSISSNNNNSKRIFSTTGTLISRA